MPRTGVSSAKSTIRRCAYPSRRAANWGSSARLRHWYNLGYTTSVKTAISIPDAVFEEAERLAQRRGWSRSELYANAVAEYIRGERFLGVRERLDAVYGDDRGESALEPMLAQAQARSLPKEKW
jgi:hypothetical protein